MKDFIYTTICFAAMPVPSTNTHAAIKVEIEQPDDPMSDDEQVCERWLARPHFHLFPIHIYAKICNHVHNMYTDGHCRRDTSQRQS